MARIWVTSGLARLGNKPASAGDRSGMPLSQRCIRQPLSGGAICSTAIGKLISRVERRPVERKQATTEYVEKCVFFSDE